MSFKQGPSILLFRLICALSIGLLLAAAQTEAQVPTEHPELIAGPWEVGGASGIDGISFEILTSTSGPTGREHFDWQAINIRVYHREAGKETWGYFATDKKASPQSYLVQDEHTVTLFDGKRLRIHFTDETDINPLDMDITFSPNANEWTGTWARAGQNLYVILKRPEPNPRVSPNSFVGDWVVQSTSGFQQSFDNSSLHIRESLDGELSAWVDRTSSSMDPNAELFHNEERNGWRLKVSSATGTGLILDCANGFGASSQFWGNLWQDRQTLNGAWEWNGGASSIPTMYRRVDAATAPVSHLSGRVRAASKKRSS